MGIFAKPKKKTGKCHITPEFRAFVEEGKKRMGQAKKNGDPIPRKSYSLRVRELLYEAASLTAHAHPDFSEQIITMVDSWLEMNDFPEVEKGAA